MSTHENEVPGRIKVKNPFSGEYEEGEFTEDGAFIGDGVELGVSSTDYGIERRVMLLGRSSVKDFSKVGTGTVINGVRLSYADIGREVKINEGSYVTGPVGSGRAIIDDGAEIGKKSFIAGMSYVGKNVKIGDNVVIDNSFIDDDSVVESGSGHVVDDAHFGQMTTKKRTKISETNVGEGSKIGRDAIIANVAIPEKSIVGPESRLISTRRAPTFWS